MQGMRRLSGSAGVCSMVPELIHTFDATINFIEASVADLSEQQMVEQPAGVPNHAAWTLGHIVYACQGIAVELGDTAWLPEDWESVFGYGSTPRADLQYYPRRAELLTALAGATSRLRQVILGASDAVLKQSLPDETLPTMAHLLWQVVVAHTAYHAGQLAAWRRAIGKGSVGVFV